MSIEPGIRTDLTNGEYHALTDWCSSSQLKAQLPEEYKPPTLGSPALSFGTLVHSVVLEPDNLGMYEPADIFEIGVKADGSRAEHPERTGAWKRFVTAAEQDGKTIVADTDWVRAHEMRDAIMAHPEARRLLFDTKGSNEESAFAVGPDGVKRKARFDRRIPGQIVDLKTTSAQPGARSLTNATVNYGYDLSAAHYMQVADLLDLDVERFTLVFVGKESPYRVTVAHLDTFFIERGRRLCEQALDRLAGRIEPYEGATEALTLTCPDWAFPDIEMEIS